MVSLPHEDSWISISLYIYLTGFSRTLPSQIFFLIRPTITTDSITSKRAASSLPTTYRVHSQNSLIYPVHRSFYLPRIADHERRNIYIWLHSLAAGSRSFLFHSQFLQQHSDSIISSLYSFFTLFFLHLRKTCNVFPLITTAVWLHDFVLLFTSSILMDKAWMSVTWTVL